MSAVVGLAVSGLAAAAMAIIPPMLEPKEEDTEVEVDLPPAYVPFEEIMVNLDEGDLNRFLRVSLTVMVKGQDEQTTTEAIERDRSALRTELLSFLSDQPLNEIRGRVGQNRLRREIQDIFNAVLVPNEDDPDLVQEVLFSEFTVN